MHGHVRKFRLETAELERAALDPPAPTQSGLLVFCKLLAVGAASTGLLYAAIYALHI